MDWTPVTKKEKKKLDKLLRKKMEELNRDPDFVKNLNEEIARAEKAGKLADYAEHASRISEAEVRRKIVENEK